MEGRVERDERIEQELAGSGVDAVPGVLGDGQERDKPEGGGERTAQRRAGCEAERAAAEEPAPQEDRRERRWEEGGNPGAQAQPVAGGAAGGPERDDERRIDLHAEKPLQRRSRQQYGCRGEGQERGEIEGFQEFTGLAAPWYSLPLIEERKEESREVSR